MVWVIEQFDSAHVRTGFDCGKPSLNDFLLQRVTQYQKRNIGRTYVLVPEGEKTVVGYYTLAASQIHVEELPEEVAKKLSRHPLPAILLGRLAVASSHHGQKLGALLLRDALQKCLDVSDTLGVFAVFVEAIDEQAVAFYVKYGFIPLKDSPNRLFLQITTLRKSRPEQSDPTPP